MEQRDVDFSSDFEAEIQQQVTDGAICYLHDPVGFVRSVRDSVRRLGPQPMREDTRRMFDRWDDEAVAFAAFLETLDASEIRDWEENLQQQRAR